ncbi:MAG: hypothetical protein JKX90_01855 [Colwellia sp.]|nr:hypothetical protein [Colwellia sp.]
MKQTSLISIFAITLIICTGCASTSINDSLALIAQENNQAVNEKVLKKIQALRAANNIKKHAYTFSYHLYDIELSYADRITIAKLLIQKKYNITINIAPAKGENKWQQLSLSMERAKVLRQYIVRLNKSVAFIFAPQLSTDTIKLVIGV